MTITKRTSTHNTTLCSRRKIEWIAIHYTAGTHSRPGAALNVVAWFKNQQNTGGSADFIVDDANVVQYNPDIRNRYCWAVGGKKYPNSKGGTLYGTVTNKNSISIEICSTSANGNIVPENDSRWSFTDAAVAQAAELTRYLMAEYGISANNVIRHYDVTGKLCPGIRGWNKESGSEKAWEQFKARITGSTSAQASTTTQPAAAVSLAPAAASETDTTKAIWDYLKGKGLSDFAVAGIMGNIYAESSLRSNNLQDSMEKKLELTDAEYTESVDSGDYENFARDGAGYGLCQWTWWERKEALLLFAKATKRSIGNLSMQLDFLWKELQEDYPSILSAFSAAASVQEASNAFLFQFERPEDKGEAVQKKRAGFGQTYYDRYSVPYLARVTVDVLRIRSGPGTSYSSLGTVKKGEAFTIVEVRDGFCRLKSGAGWIAEKHTERVKPAS